MGTPQELDFPQLAGFQKLLYIEKLIGIKSGLHHHISLSAFALSLCDLADPLQAGSHGNGAGAVLARLQNRNALLLMQGNGRHKMDCVYGRILEDILQAGIFFFYTQLFPKGLFQRLIRVKTASSPTIGCSLYISAKAPPNPRPTRATLIFFKLISFLSHIVLKQNVYENIDKI